MSDNTYTPRRTAWDVKWNALSLGTVYDVDPSSIKIVLDPIRRGTFGKMVLGHWASGLEGMLKVQAADVTLLLQTNVCPWLDSAVAVMHPNGLYVNMYQYAQALLLHPHDTATTAEDVTLVKTVPITPPGMIHRDGQKDEEWDLDFILYPDLAKLQQSPPVVMYGYVGASEPTG